MKTIEVSESALESLKAMAEQLEKDAARYRWLRMQHWSESEFSVVKNPKKAVVLGYECPSSDRLDEQIDAQIAACQESTKVME